MVRRKASVAVTRSSNLLDRRGGWRIAGDWGHIGVLAGGGHISELTLNNVPVAHPLYSGVRISVGRELRRTQQPRHALLARKNLFVAVWNSARPPVCAPAQGIDQPWAAVWRTNLRLVARKIDSRRPLLDHPFRGAGGFFLSEARRVGTSTCRIVESKPRARELTVSLREFM